jgi:hypothetical protein
MATSLTRGIPLIDAVSSLEVVTKKPTQPTSPTQIQSCTSDVVVSCKKIRMRFFFQKARIDLKIFKKLSKFYIICRINYFTKFILLILREKCQNIFLNKESDESIRIFLQDAITKLQKSLRSPNPIHPIKQ